MGTDNSGGCDRQLVLVDDGMACMRANQTVLPGSVPVRTRGCVSHVERRRLLPRATAIMRLGRQVTVHRSDARRGLQQARDMGSLRRCLVSLMP
jgi:hypothetical protein